MKNRVFIIHGWGGAPTEDWLPWLTYELTKRGYEITTPQMPDTMAPHITEWVPYLKKLVGKPDKNTFFVGHSMGTQTILRYLQNLPEKTKVGGVILVAPFVHLTHEILQTKKDKIIARPWLKNKLKWHDILKHTNKFITLFSDDDPFVPLSDSRVFKKNLHAKVVVEHRKGHMSMNEHVFRIPDVLDAILSLSKKCENCRHKL